jgi:hypothetical protein
LAALPLALPLIDLVVVTHYAWLDSNRAPPQRGVTGGTATTCGDAPETDAGGALRNPVRPAADLAHAINAILASNLPADVREQAVRALTREAGEGRPTPGV